MTGIELAVMQARHQNPCSRQLLNIWTAQHSESNHAVILNTASLTSTDSLPSPNITSSLIPGSSTSQPFSKFGCIVGSWISWRWVPQVIYQFGNEFHGLFSFLVAWVRCAAEARKGSVCWLKSVSTDNIDQKALISHLCTTQPVRLQTHLYIIPCKWNLYVIILWQDFSFFMANE